MQADLYLQKILSREEVDTSMSSPINNVIRGVSPIISHWAGGYLVGVYKSGSFAKGTANKSGTDIDLLISLSNSTPNSLGDVYDRLYTYLYN